ncbi:blastula protease 10-like [Hydractinia symbiolongicarpus]|uniref:blastula protease 10-like n=1 Tax=Hydractinia symbiolongicarpus TaxID=13093 RepID=UPI0025506281|nr:blastula protease 10-like [Hydractinia symbiolongicarpus]
MNPFYFILTVTLICLSSATAQECGRNLNATSGTIESPNYPNQYPENLTCTWVITGGPDKKIQINVEDLDIDAQIHETCSSEYLRIIVDRTPNDFCGTTKPAAFNTSSDEVTIKFVSDSKNSTKKGFRLSYAILEPAKTTQHPDATTLQPTTGNNVTYHPSNITSTSLPTVKPKESKEFPAWCIAVIVIVVLLVVLLIIDLVLYRKNMGLTYTVKSACCGGYEQVA